MSLLLFTRVLIFRLKLLYSVYSKNATILWGSTSQDLPNEKLSLTYQKIANKAFSGIGDLRYDWMTKAGVKKFILRQKHVF